MLTMPNGSSKNIGGKENGSNPIAKHFLPFKIGHEQHYVTAEVGDFQIDKTRSFIVMRVEILRNNFDASNIINNNEIIADDAIESRDALFRFRIDRVIANFEMREGFIHPTLLADENNKNINVIGSVGAFGTYPASGHGRVARDGTTFIDEPNDFGQEWQVRPDLGDPILFHEPQYPQYPEKCIPPPSSTAAEGHRRRRQLHPDDNKVLRSKAENACGFIISQHGNANDIEKFENCIFDVMMTGEEDAALTYVGF